MRRQIPNLLLLFLFINVCSYVRAQESNGIVVEVSKEKTKINGKTFYLHTVKKGENIFRISKAYKVTQKDIIIANPETISGTVKEGQILKIPIDPKTPRSIDQIESDNFIYHIAEEQQTIFFICQKYKVTQEVLNKYNPELEFSGLQVGQVVRIPKAVDVSSKSESFHPIENYEEHKVKRKETKYSISNEYNLTVDELIAANPILNSEDLKAGSIIRIPKKSDSKLDTKPLLEKSDSIVRVNKSAKLEKASIPMENKPFSGELKIALLLPFSIDDNETRAKLDSAAGSNSRKSGYVHSEFLPRTVYALEFYQGFLLAVDSMKKAGLSVKVTTFDTERETGKVNKILAKPAMSEMDFIVGPFFQEGLVKANEFSLNNHVKLISPVIKENTNLAKNPYLFQFIPSDKSSVDAMFRFINSIPQKNIILIEGNDAQDREMTQLFKDRLNVFFPNSFKIINSSKLANLVHNYSKVSENIILVPSVNEAFIFSLFSKLNHDSKIYPIKVFGLPNCARFKNIDQLYFHNLEFHYFTPFYVDYSDASVKRFVSLYEKMFSFEPQDFSKEGFNFAMLGFDLGYYFLRALSNKGSNLESSLNNAEFQPLHTKIRFVKDSITGGFVNHEVQIVKFTKDYFIKKAN